MLRLFAFILGATTLVGFWLMCGPDRDLIRIGSLLVCAVGVVIFVGLGIWARHDGQ